MLLKLTVKECKVLELLYKSFRKLIPRETLIQEVWINDGVITVGNHNSQDTIATPQTDTIAQQSLENLLQLEAMMNLN